MPTTVVQDHELSTVDLTGRRSSTYTNCGVVSASNVDQELSLVQGRDTMRLCQRARRVSSAVYATQ